MRFFSFFTGVGFLLLSFFSTPAHAETIYEEVSGLVAVEAEHFASKTTNGTPRAWYLTSTTNSPNITPDSDSNHASTASGGAYMEGLPDTRATHDDPLQPGVNYFGTAGTGPTLNYRVKFNTPGKYYIRVRAFSSGPEDNGLHVGLNGQWPTTGNRIQWCDGKHMWTWSGAQRTDQEHCGVANGIYLNIPSAGIHTVSFSMREDGFEIDKWVMTNNSSYFPTGQGPAERIYGDGGTDVGSTENQAPSITSNSKTSAIAGMLYQYDVEANDPDTNDKLTYSLTAAPAGMTINSTSGLISWNPSQQGSYSVTVKVTDSSGLFDRQSFTISVSDATSHNYELLVSNNPDRSSATALNKAIVSGKIYVFVPALSGISQVQFYLNGKLYRTEKLAPWDFAGGSAGLANAFDTNSLTKGLHTLDAQIDSNGVRQLISVNFQVDNSVTNNPPPSSNTAPVIYSTPVLSILDGGAYYYDVEARDSDSGDRLTYSLVKSPSGMRIEAATGKINWTPNNQPGAHEITALVKDQGGLSDIQIYTLKVLQTDIPVDNGDNIESSLISNFDLDNEGFTYVDDFFGTAHPPYAEGGYTPDDGYSGGGLRVSLGGVDSIDIIDGMSGGWTKDFHIDASGPVTITFKYLLQINRYDTDECSQVLAAIDGELVNFDSNNFIDQLCGMGSSNPPQDSGWQEVTFEIPLTQGPHSLTLGGLNNKKTYFEEVTNIVFDEVGIFSTNDIGNDLNSGTDGFVYVDDILGTSNPSYAEGIQITHDDYTGGTLQVTLGGVDSKDILDGIAGGWNGEFTLATDDIVTFILNYRLVISGKYESDECGQAVVTIDDNPISFGLNEFLVELCGITGNDPVQDTGWQQTSFSLPLTAGIHSITVGGWNNKKTYLDEIVDVYFDNISISAGNN